MEANEMTILSDISVKVGKLETLQEQNAKAIGELANSLNRLVEKFDRSDDIAKAAMQTAEMAHKRIDALKEDTEKDLKSFSDNLKWLWGAFIAVVGIALSLWGF